jgi:hypothetical protein
MLEVKAKLDEELAVQRQALDELTTGDLARLQALAAERGLGYVVTAPGGGGRP